MTNLPGADLNAAYSGPVRGKAQEWAAYSAAIKESFEGWKYHEFTALCAYLRDARQAPA